MTDIHPTAAAPPPAEPSARTRLVSPGWRLDDSGNFTLDLSWDDDSRRWLEVRPDPDSEHGWRLTLCEADDDSSDAAHEDLEFGVADVTKMLASVEADPWDYDRSPA